MHYPQAGVRAAGALAQDTAIRSSRGLASQCSLGLTLTVVLVTDDDIRRAQTMLCQALRIVTEAGGAPLVSGRYHLASGERIAALLCDVNTTAVDFER